MADLDALLAPVSDDDIVGPDLSYDTERAEIERAFETSVSDDAVGGDVDWRAIIGLIEVQSKRTKDLWLAAYLARAGARSGRFDLVVTGVNYLAGLLERYWPTVHPQLDEVGFQGRKTPVEALTHFGQFLRPLASATLLEHPRLGAYSGADFQRFANEGGDADGYGMFRAAIEEDPEALRNALDQLDALRDGIRRADTVLTAEAGDNTGTNFAATYEAVESIRRSVGFFAGSGEDAAGDAGAAEGASYQAPASAGGGGGGGGSTGGRIENREDVARAIDAIIDYYRRREPGSPVPVLLGRAREWLGADFLTLLQDIAPAGMEDIRRVLVSQRTDEY